MENLGQWPAGWTILGDTEDYAELGIAYGKDMTIADNMYWTFDTDEDFTERKTEFSELLHRMNYNVTVVDTDTLSGIVLDAGKQFDFTDEGAARGLYTLKFEKTPQVYAANASTADKLIDLMEDYAENAPDTNTDKYSSNAVKEADPK